jgi:hypothetical protein
MFHSQERPPSYIPLKTMCLHQRVARPVYSTHEAIFIAAILLSQSTAQFRIASPHQSQSTAGIRWIWDAIPRFQDVAPVAYHQFPQVLASINLFSEQMI